MNDFLQPLPIAAQPGLSVHGGRGTRESRERAGTCGVPTTPGIGLRAPWTRVGHYIAEDAVLEGGIPSVPGHAGQ